MEKGEVEVEKEDDEEEDDDETVFDKIGGHLKFEFLFLLQLKLLEEEGEGSADCSRFSVIIGWLL